MIPMGVRRIVACACALLWPVMAAAAQPAPSQSGAGGIERLVNAIERAAEAGDADAIRALALPDVRPTLLSEFVQSLTFPKVSHATVKERDRPPLESGRVRLLLETLTDRAAEGRVSTWRLDIEPAAGAVPWKIADVERLSVISGLFRLSLDQTTEYEVKNLVISAPDLTLTLPSGQAFVAKTPDGPTALVLLGRGRMEFSPKAEAERGQVRIFSGADALEDRVRHGVRARAAAGIRRAGRGRGAQAAAGGCRAPAPRDRRSSRPTCPRASSSISTI